MAGVRNLLLLFATLCCYASISHANEPKYEGNPDIDHENLVELARQIGDDWRLLELGLGIQNNDDEDIVKSLSKRQAGNNPASGLPMNVPVKMSGFAFGKRDSPLVRRSAGAGSKPVKLAGFAFGKRNQPVKRSSDDQAQKEEDKRGSMDAFTFGKRLSGDPSALSAFSFGKRRDPVSSLSALTFGKRGMDPSGFSAFNFGKRRDPLSAFNFGKRGGMDASGLSAFSFGKRGLGDASGLSAFSFGKRGRMPSLSAFDFGKRGTGGMDAFTFGKREGLDEEGAFEDENDDEKRFNGISGYTFGKRDTNAAAEDADTLNHNEETLRTD